MAFGALPQFLSLLPEILIFFGGGFDLSVSLGTSYHTYNLEFRFCWFIGTILGAFLAAPLLQLVRGRHLVHFACVVMLVGGIVTVSDYGNVTALIAARYLNGIAVGFVTVEFIVRGGEITSPKFRNFCLGWEQFGLFFGAFIQTIYTTQWSPEDFSSDCLRGIFTIVSPVLAMLVSFFHIESPVRYLIIDDNANALVCVKQLSWPRGTSEAKRLVFDELVNYVLDSQTRPIGQSMRLAPPPLLKMVLYRSMLSFLLAMPLSDALAMSGLVAVPNAPHNWPPLVYSAIPIMGMAIGFTLCTLLGVKLISLISLFIAGACIIAVGAVFDGLSEGGTYPQALAAFILLMIGDLFASFFAVTTTYYLGVAFPLYCKANYVAQCVIVQYLVDLIIVCTFISTAYNIFAFCVAAGVIVCVSTIIFWIFVPDTANTTLREAELRFARTKNYQSF